jgi:phosphopantothenoylcysteine decarboxylase/phosphopantothenate--cysteine ligase
MAAAVADFRPMQAAEHKIKKSDTNEAGLTLELVRTPDILAAVNQQRAGTGRPRVVIGFAAESDAVIDYARDKLARKGLDLIAANDITAPDAGFDVETNRLILIGRAGEPEDLGLLSKARAAEIVIARAADLLRAAST